MSGTALRRALAVTAILAVVLVFSLEGISHHHENGFDGRDCPACQAARQHVGDSPRSASSFLRAPAPERPPVADPAIDRVVGAPVVSSSSPRSPPVVSA
jgi:hypothetical protein